MSLAFPSVLPLSVSFVTERPLISHTYRSPELIQSCSAVRAHLLHGSVRKKRNSPKSASAVDDVSTALAFFSEIRFASVRQLTISPRMANAVVELNFTTKITQLSLNHNQIFTALLFSAPHAAAILEVMMWLFLTPYQRTNPMCTCCLQGKDHAVSSPRNDKLFPDVTKGSRL